MIRLLTVALLLALLLPEVAAAQVPQMVPAVRLEGVDRHPDGWRYRYQVVGYAPGGQRISDVYLDVSAPKGDRPPRMLGTRGEFLFDAAADHGDRAEVGHAPLFIGTPAGWRASVYIHGLVAWGAARRAGTPGAGVPSGRVLTGFELRSPAPPALRRYSAVPYRRFAAAEADPEAVDSTWVLLEGYVVGPGLPEEQLDGDFVERQVHLACEARLMDGCPVYRQLVRRLRAGERARNRAEILAALSGLEAEVRADRVSVPSARFVVREAAAVLRRRWEAPRRPGSGR